MIAANRLLATDPLVPTCSGGEELALWTAADPCGCPGLLLLLRVELPCPLWELRSHSWTWAWKSTFHHSAKCPKARAKKP